MGIEGLRVQLQVSRVGVNSCDSEVEWEMKPGSSYCPNPVSSTFLSCIKDLVQEIRSLQLQFKVLFCQLQATSFF